MAPTRDDLISACNLIRTYIYAEVSHNIDLSDVLIDGVNDLQFTILAASDPTQGGEAEDDIVDICG